MLRNSIRERNPSTVGIMAFFVLTCLSCLAQESYIKPVRKSETNLIIQKIADSLETYYVSLEIGKKIGHFIKDNYKKGKYNKLNKPKELAVQLTKDLRALNGDKHLSVSFRPINKKSNLQKDSKKIDESGLWSNYGFQEVQILDGNIGYIRITNFSNWNYLPEAKEAASAAMNMASNTDAIIFDVRNNKGGVPYLVSHLASYLFQERVHLTQYVHRFNNGGYNIYTETNIPGRKRPEVPVYILVNSKTASAGEEFAFWLKHLKRATIIGEVTMGAGYGAMTHRLNDRFMVSISSEEEINPITKSGFEKVGVIPDIQTTSNEALDKAKELAEISSRQHRKRTTVRNKNLLELMNYTIKNDSSTVYSILDVMRKCIVARVLDERKINDIGYDYITKYKKTKTAEYILKANTILYSESANVYDSYGEILAINKNLSASLVNYKKAVEIAKKNNDSNLNLFIANMEKIENSIKN